ncbi:flagellin [Halovibrio sp. HP20-50]|uniref:flagellin N-terminal helical domain-containing protein n=1 Tax=Halovibrio sp. HP20-59 TaxID=3080275 RepID=UPI00294B397B|nr:flagellin [Halovibrio sp. HP20-59]MEA2119683.1 flagellin [Halovibrio sp. HP20-59]
MSVINTNITSMIGQQNLNKSQNDLQTSMERLSSGLRINSAKDDAAGQAIANRFTAQITGLGQAQRNANDGISIAQTAEGGLNQVNDNLQRIRELSVQAQNGTNSDSDLNSIQDEINQRLDEINRISEETDFNGTKVLAGDEGLKIQVGANDGQTISVNLKQINAETLNLAGFNVNGTGTANSTATVQDLRANDFTQVGTSNEYTNANFNTASSVGDLFENLKDGATVEQMTDNVEYTLNADTNTFSFDRTGVAVDGTAGNLATDLGLTPGAGETSTITVNLGGDDKEVNVSSSGALTLASTGENLYLTGTAGSADLSVTNTAGDPVATIDDLVSELADVGRSAGSITTAEDTVYSADGLAGSVNTTNETIAFEDLQNQVAQDTTNAYDVDTDGEGTAANLYGIDATNAVYNDVSTGTQDATTATYTSGFDGDYSLTSGTTGATASVYVNDNGKITDGAASEIFVTEDGSLTKEALSDADATENPLAALDNALSQVDSLRSELGAVQNRFESAITNLSTNETNLSAARSRIEDADYAVEVANMTRAQILQQAGTSVLAQANQIPQNVLSLLG